MAGIQHRHPASAGAGSGVQAIVTGAPHAGSRCEVSLVPAAGKSRLGLSQGNSAMACHHQQVWNIFGNWLLAQDALSRLLPSQHEVQGPQLLRCKSAAHLPQVHAGVQLPDATSAAGKQHRTAYLHSAAHHCAIADFGVNVCSRIPLGRREQVMGIRSCSDTCMKAAR